MKNVLIAIIIGVVVAGILYIIPHKTQAPVQAPINVVDFQTCVDAGNQVLETDPPVCSTPDGKTFVGQTTASADVVLDTPQFGDLVASPLTITGKAKGTWFFEANLPIELKDEQGNVIAQQGYHTDDNWMTEDYVNINTQLTFPTPATDYGVLIIHNDNPSGMPENDKQYAVPVRFK